MLHAQVSNTTLGIVRVVVYAMWFKHLWQDSLERYIRTPIEFFTPIGPLAWVPDGWWPWLYQVDVANAARSLLLVGLAFCVAGLRPYRPVAIATCIGLTLYQAFVRGYGYMFHGELAMLTAAFVLAAFPAARGASLRRTASTEAFSSHDLNRAAMLTLCLTLCLTYTFVGTQRVLHGGLGIYLDGTILHYIARETFEGNLVSPGIGRLVLESKALGHVVTAGFAATTLFEVCAPLAIFSRWFRWIWMIAIIGFHVGSGLLMGIWFTANIALILLCMTGLERHLERGKRLVFDR